MLTSSGIAVCITRGQASLDQLAHGAVRTKVINGITWIEADVIMDFNNASSRPFYDLSWQQTQAFAAVRCTVYTVSSIKHDKKLRGEVNLSLDQLQPFKIHSVNDLMGAQLRVNSDSRTLHKSNGVAGYVQFHVEFQEMVTAPNINPGTSRKVIFQLTIRSAPNLSERTLSSSSRRAANQKSTGTATACSNSENNDLDSDKELEGEREENDNNYGRANTFKRQRVNLRSSKQNPDVEDFESKLEQAWKDVQKEEDMNTLAKQKQYQKLIDTARMIQSDTKNIEADTEQLQLRQKELSRKRK